MFVINVRYLWPVCTCNYSLSQHEKIKIGLSERTRDIDRTATLAMESKERSTLELFRIQQNTLFSAGELDLDPSTSLYF